MMKLITLFLIFAPLFSFSQKENKEIAKHKIEPNTAWHADILGNLYIAEKDLLTKYDTSNVKQYSQSIKSKGRISSILSINTMRIVLFSEQQQTFTLMDNTLSEANKTYDLSELGFVYVPLMAVSSQPNKFWIYDQANAKLVLLDLSRTNQQQEIDNVRGILNSTEILWMKEDNNILYLFDSNHKLYSFDLYGSLIDVLEFPDSEFLEIHNGEIFLIKDFGIFRYRKEDESLESLNINFSGIIGFQWTNNTFFVQSKWELLKYRINL